MSDDEINKFNFIKKQIPFLKKLILTKIKEKKSKAILVILKRKINPIDNE